MKALRASFKKMGYPMSVYSDDDKRGNYTDRKEYNSKLSNKIFKADKIEYDIMGN